MLLPRPSCKIKPLALGRALASLTPSHGKTTRWCTTVGPALFSPKASSPEKQLFTPLMLSGSMSLDVLTQVGVGGLIPAPGTDTHVMRGRMQGKKPQVEAEKSKARCGVCKASLLPCNPTEGSTQ